MRIGIDCRKLADYGIGTYIRGLLTGIAALAHDHRFVLFAPARLAPRIPNDPRFELIDINAPHYTIRELLIVGRAARKASLELLHAPHYVTPFTSIPLVVTIHDLIHLHQPVNPVVRAYARWMIRRSIRISEKVMTVSRTVAAEIEALEPAAARNLVVTANGVDPRFFLKPSGSEIEATLGRYGLARQRYVLFVGNEKAHKNLGTLIEAFELAASEEPGLMLVIAGSDESRWRGTVRIRPVGFVPEDDLAHLYRGSLTLVLPSLEEGFGLPALEAMAAGTAAITSNAASLVETTGDAALHVDSRDHRGLAAAILSIARDPSLRSDLIARGTERARAYSWEECARKTIEVYESVRDSW